ncbi:daunorubicin resistance ABC transporter ATP-binding subunit [Thaumarchaeota archaeon SCGC AB-539-E09]|nr:daunorubicin resistance ABC transporter ATP-binding subunit [Thaumarchaeota archaeon SCGC AB-539-E09]
MTEVKAIEAKSLTKYYKAFLAVDRISFDVNQGEIFGFLGPNGAGKSTTIRMLTGISTPTEGAANIMGFDITRQPVDAKSVMGIVPDISNIYTELTAWENLIFTGKLYGIPKKRREESAESLLKRFELYGRKDEEVDGFSRGMKRRVCIAMALVNDSKVLFLDEPTSGLDVKSVRGIRGMIRELNSEGLTVFLTTHNIEEASQMCDRIAIINRGKIAVIDTPESIKRALKSSQSVEVSFRETTKETQKVLEELSSVTELQKRGDKLRLLTRDPTQTLRQLWGVIEVKGLEPITINTLGSSLEDAFLKLTGTEMEAEVIKRRRGR